MHPSVGRVHESRDKSEGEGEVGAKREGSCWLGQGGRNASGRAYVCTGSSPSSAPPRRTRTWQLCYRPFFSTSREGSRSRDGENPRGWISRTGGNHAHTSADATRLAGTGDDTTAMATRSAGVPATRPTIGRAEYWASRPRHVTSVLQTADGDDVRRRADSWRRRARVPVFRGVFINLRESLNQNRISKQNTVCARVKIAVRFEYHSMSDTVFISFLNVLFCAKLAFCTNTLLINILNDTKVISLSRCNSDISPY